MRKLTIALVCMGIILFLLQINACSQQGTGLQDTNQNKFPEVTQSDIPNSERSETEHMVNNLDIYKDQTYRFEDFDSLVPGESTVLDLFKIVPSATATMYGRGTVFEIPADQGRRIVVVASNVIEAIYITDTDFTWEAYDHLLKNPDVRPKQSRFMQGNGSPIDS